MAPRLMALAASVVLCAAILLSTVPGTVEAAPGTDPAQALDKLFADNALTDSWKGFKKYFVEAYEKDQLEAVTPLLKSLAADPVKAIAVVSGFGEDLAKAGGEPDLVVVLDAIGRMLGFQVPAEAPKFALSEDPKELVDAIYVTIEAAGGLAVTATGRSLFKNDRFTTHGMLATTVYRLSENIYMNYEASEDLAKSLSKTKTQVWIDVMTMLRSSADVDVNLIWMSMRERSEERRVGQECRSRWSPDYYKKKKTK